jgi:hypothetical protein
MKRPVALLTVAAFMVVMLLPAGGATAQEESVTVEVGPTAKLLDDGQAVRVKVKVACEPPAEVLEALVTVHQDEGAAFGEAGITSVVCDGRTHVHKVEVEALDSTFHAGEAFVSAFVLVCLDPEDPECTDTAQGQDSTVVKVVGSRR